MIVSWSSTSTRGKTFPPMAQDGMTVVFASCDGDSDGRPARLEGNTAKGRRDRRGAEADAVRDRLDERPGLRGTSSREWSVL